MIKGEVLSPVVVAWIRRARCALDLLHREVVELRRGADLVVADMVIMLDVHVTLN